MQRTYEFQFQTGSIKSGITMIGNRRTRICFNSKLVRLKELNLAIHAEVISVSIPNWFD